MAGDLGVAGDDMPLVSFVILGFNQKDFIEQAIDAALAQEYSNLQVLLSDDGSSDGTFEIMQARAAAYCGPHRVRAIRTPRNFGLVHHLFCAAAIADGELIVVAGGDDISLPHRVSALVAAWQASGADALFSGWTVIEVDGRPAFDGPTPLLRRAQRYFPDLPIVPILGVSAAYDRRVFENIAQPNFPVWAEDFFFFLMLGFRSRAVAVLDERLVEYRRHDSALTHRIGGDGTLEQYERNSQKVAHAAADIMNYFECSVIADSGYTAGYGELARVDLAALRSDIAFTRWQSCWVNASPATALRESLRHFRINRARWLLPRMLGIKGFRLLKRRHR